MEMFTEKITTGTTFPPQYVVGEVIFVICAAKIRTCLSVFFFHLMQCRKVPKGHESNVW